MLENWCVLHKLQYNDYQFSYFPQKPQIFSLLVFIIVVGSILCAYTRIPLQSGMTNFDLLSPIITIIANLAILIIRFGCKMKHSRANFASGGAFSGILRSLPGKPLAGTPSAPGGRSILLVCVASLASLYGPTSLLMPSASRLVD